MKKFRIIEKRYPLSWYYAERLNEQPPKDVSFSSPIMFLQERKSIFHKWKTIKEINTILEAEYYIYNQKVEKLKTITQVIKKL